LAVCLSLFNPINSLRIFSSIAIASGSYFCFFGFQLLARIHFLLSTPSPKICNAALGPVEVNGWAVGPHSMSAPITGQACFLYRTTAWRQTHDKKHKWEKVADETLHAPFFIEDSSGHLLIEPFGADLDLHCDFQQEFDQPSASPAARAGHIPLCVSAFLSRHAVASDCRLRIEEQLIKPKDALFIAGTLRKNPGIEVYGSPPRSELRSTFPDHDPSYDRNDVRNDVRNPSLPVPTANNDSESFPAPQIIRLAAAAAAGASASHQMGQQAKIAAALTRAGIVKPEVWTPTGVAYSRLSNPAASGNGASDNDTTGKEGPRPIAIATAPRPDSHLHEVRIHDEWLREEQFQSTGLNSAPPVVLTKGSNNPTFVISFRSQKAGLRGLAWKCAGMICGGSAMALLGFYMLLA
jgi:hypothetical protein